MLAVLNLSPPDLLPFARPDTLAILPSEYTDTLDPELQAELDELAAEYGGIGQYTLAEAREVEPGQIGVFPTATPEPTAEPEPTEAAEEPVVEVPEVEPVDLPESWITAAAQAGQTLETTADITPEVMELLAGFAPELLNDLTPEMWRALDPAAVAAALPAVPDLDPALATQLEAIQLAATGETPEPVALPESWTAAAAQAGQELETTADVTPETMELLVGFAPDLLDDLTEEQILAFAPDVQAVLPADYVAGLDEGLQETLGIIATRQAQYLAAEEAAEEPAELDVELVALPESWITAAAQAGQTLETTADITPEVMELLAGFAPELAPRP
jgi:hypothetical protein